MSVENGICGMVLSQGWGYMHDLRADKYPYPHDRRADKDSYPNIHVRISSLQGWDSIYR